MTAAEVAAALGIDQAEVERIAAGGVTTTSEVYSQEDLAEARLNGAARRAAESQQLIAAAIARRTGRSA